MTELISANTLIQKLALVNENILAEAAEQPLLFVEAARFRVSKMQERSQASAALDTYRAKLALHIRAIKDTEGKKITEGAIAQKIEVSKHVQELRKSFEDSVGREELAKLILEAFRMRRDAIRIIAEAQVYEGASESQELDKVMHKKMVNQAKLLAQKHKEEE